MKEERDAELRRARGGALIMIAAMLILPGLDAAGKLLGEGEGVYGPPMSAVQIAWARFAVQTVLTIPIAFWVLGGRALAAEQLGLLALRGVFLSGTTVFFFAAVSFMGLAESIAIFFVEPLLLTILSALVLGERIGWRRVTAVLVGLAGAMVIIRPNFLAIGPAALLPLAAAVSFAFYLLVTKLTAARTHPLTSHLWTGLAGLAVLTPLMLTLWGVEPALADVGLSGLAPHWPTMMQLGLLAIAGVIANVGHFLVILAFARAPASTLAPLQYFEIVSATALGWLIFGDFPDAVTWIGVAIIVASGLFVFERQRRHRETRAAAG